MTHPPTHPQGEYTEEDSIKAWEVMMDRYAGAYNVFAADLRNEPHGLASWGESHPLTDYNAYYERLINRLAARYPNWKVGSFLLFLLPPTHPPTHSNPTNRACGWLKAPSTTTKATNPLCRSGGAATWRARRNGLSR